MTTVTAASSSQQQNYVQNAGTTQLSKDAFLQLLVTQLRYQDPLQASDNGEFLAQMAQFSALEQAQNINGNLEQLMLNQSSQLESLLELVAGLSQEMSDLSNLLGIQQYARMDEV